MSGTAQPFLATADFTLYVGDVREVLRGLPAQSVDCCVTSPPYWGLRDYGHQGQIGLEETPDEYVSCLTAVFGEVRRLLKPEGTLWLNLGDSYSQGNKGNSGAIRPGDKQGTNAGSLATRRGEALGPNRTGGTKGWCKPKDLVGIPWAVAFALRDDGWYLRSDIIWSKPNAMPESVTDRPTKAHEYVFLLTAGPRYFFDQDAVLEPYQYDGRKQTTIAPHDANAHDNYENRHGRDRWPRRSGNKERKPNPAATLGQGDTKHGIPWEEGVGRNVRTVWEIPTQPYPEAHFATYPEKLVERCLLAGCPAGGVVLDPFMGSGTTAKVARDLGRRAIGVELNAEYAALCERRNGQQTIFAEAS